MKVVGIDSSKRKRNTYRLLLSIEPLLNENGIEFEYINLHDYNIQFCKGCEVCVLKDFCTIDDDMKTINGKLEEADGVIFSSPVYMENIAGIFKTFTDRNCKWYHRSPLLKKPFLAMATTNGSGLNYSLKYLERVATRWGMVPCGRIGRKFRTVKDSISEKEIGKFIEFIKSPESIRQWISPLKYINYNVQKAISLTLFNIDRKFWKEKGIDKKHYYYDFYTDPISYLTGNFLFKLLSKKLEESHDKEADNY